LRSSTHLEVLLKPLSGITRTHHVVAGIVALLVLAGCADQQPTTPTVPRFENKSLAVPEGQNKAFDISKKPDFRATVTTVVTSREKNGKTSHKKISQRVKASFQGGIARATLEAASADWPAATFAKAAEGVAALVQSSNPSILTPVLATTTGEIALNYADTTTDADGNVFEVYGWAYNEGSPITDAWAYKNGVLIIQYHADWTPAIGGHLLSQQILGSYYQDGTLAGTLVSTVTLEGGPCSVCVVEPLKNEFFGSDLGAGIGSYLLAAVDKIGCWISPEVAYAIITCNLEIASLAIDTFTLGVATYTGAAFVAPVPYFMIWGSWTDNLIQALRCIDSQRRPIRTPRQTSACRTNPRLCTGGGGSTW
jgi:hypothetical protein